MVMDQQDMQELDGMDLQDLVTGKADAPTAASHTSTHPDTLDLTTGSFYSGDEATRGRDDRRALQRELFEYIGDKLNLKNPRSVLFIEFSKKQQYSSYKVDVTIRGGVLETLRNKGVPLLLEDVGYYIDDRYGTFGGHIQCSNDELRVYGTIYVN